MNDDSEQDALSERIKELGDKSSQILLFLSFAIVVVVLRESNQQLLQRQKNALHFALWSWALAIFPVVLGILPLKEFGWEKTDWYRKVRKAKCVLLWLAILLIIAGAIAFACSICTGRTADTQARAFTANKDWVKAARNWGWSGLSSWSDEAILRNLSTPIGFRAAFPEYGAWDDDPVRDIAVQARLFHIAASHRASS